MTPWTRLLRYPDTIEALYASPPSLQRFAITEIGWESDPHICILRGVLAKFPDYPMDAWESDANRIGLRLILEGLHHFEMTGWSFENLVDLTIETDPENGQILINARGDELSLSARCTSLHLRDIYAYRSLRAEPVN